MTFRDIAIKNFKRSKRRYLSYFLNNSFAIMLLFIYSTLIFNNEFKNSPSIEKSIVKIMIFPDVVLILFEIIFVTYSYNIFIKSRQKEFGVFMNLGMSISDIRKLIFVENGLVALSSMLLGIVSGTVFAKIFFVAIMRLIDVGNIGFHIGIKNYMFSLGIFTCILLFPLIRTLISTRKFEIIKLLSADKKIKLSKINNAATAVLGGCVLVISLFVLYKYFDGSSTGLLLGVVLGCSFSIYIIISGLEGVIVKFMSKSKSRFYNNLITIRDLNYKFNETKKVIYIIAMMTFIIIFINGLYLNLMLSAENIAKSNNKFDISFVQMTGKNDVPDKSVESIIKDDVKQHKKIEFIWDEENIIFSDSEFNKNFKSNFNVKENNYIKVIQNANLKAKEKRELYENEMKYKHLGVIEGYKNQGYEFKNFFNSPVGDLSEIIVISDEAYKILKVKNSNVKVGKVQLWDFDEWKKTQPLVNKLENTFKAYNKNDSDYLKVASKIGTYNQNKQGGKILFYLLLFLGIFFFVSVSTVLFLKLYSEIEIEKDKYRQIYKIGITDEEIKKIISNELKILFFSGIIVAIPVAFIFSSIYFSKDNSALPKYLWCNLIVSCIFIVVEVIYYFIARNIYTNEIIMNFMGNKFIKV